MAPKKKEVKIPEGTIKHGEITLINEKKGLFAKAAKKEYCVISKDFVKCYKKFEDIEGKPEFEMKITKEIQLVKKFFKKN
jgi:hypothetical protein